MRNIIYSMIVTAIFFTACSKDSLPKSLQKEVGTYTMEIIPSPNNYYKQEQTEQKVTYKVKEGRIILDNPEDFKIFMWALESRNLDKWENEITFQSFRTANPSTLSQSNINECRALASALNPDGIIQVEPYLFKFDLFNEKIYVMETIETLSIEEFSQTRNANAIVKAFSFDDDIWYLLANDLAPNEDLSSELSEESEGKKCNEQKAFNKKEVQSAQPCTGTSSWWQEVNFILRYNRFGIWETCIAAFENNYKNVYSQTNGYYEDFFVYGGIINYHFDERCGPAYQGSFQIPSMTIDKLAITLRSNKKPLARYKSNVTMELLFKYLCAPNDPIQQHTISLNNF